MRLSFVTAAGLLAPVYSSAIGLRDNGIDVNLESVGNTGVQVTLRNDADHEISVLNLNSFFDSSPIQKVRIHKEGDNDEVPFDGIQPRYKLSSLTEDDFVPLSPGASITSDLDIADTFDLSQGGTYVVSSQGVLPIGHGPNCTNLSGVVPYKSNEIRVQVDGHVAARHLPSRRSPEITSCTGSHKEALATALQNSAKLASHAASAALTGSVPKFEEYFRTSDPDTRSTVAARFAAIAEESSASTSSTGKTEYHCEDTLGYCTAQTLAYTIPSRGIIVNCPVYYELPARTRRCHGQDQATTTLHEFSHAREVYAPATLDHVYGYAASVALSAEEAVCNADTFALYANALDVGC